LHNYFFPLLLIKKFFSRIKVYALIRGCEVEFMPRMTKKWRFQEIEIFFIISYNYSNDAPELLLSWQYLLYNKSCAICIYEIVIYRLVVSTKKQCGVLKIRLGRLIKTLLYETLYLCAIQNFTYVYTYMCVRYWCSSWIIRNDISMTLKSSVCKCYLQSD